MFRGEWCENYREESECRENPEDDCGMICKECSEEWEYDKE